MPYGAIEQETLAQIERHIEITEAFIEDLSADIGWLTPMEEQALLAEKMLLESLYEDRQAILEGLRLKRDPSYDRT